MTRALLAKALRVCKPPLVFTSSKGGSSGHVEYDYAAWAAALVREVGRLRREAGNG